MEIPHLIQDEPRGKNKLETQENSSPEDFEPHSLPANVNKTPDNLTFQFTLSLSEKFNFANSFFKSNNSALHLPYDIKNQLYALRKQATVGPQINSPQIELGYFDWVGRDRRNAWQALGDMGKNESMEKFVGILLEEEANFEEALKNHAEDMKNQEMERLERIYEEEKKRLALEWEEKQKNQEIETERDIHEELLRQAVEQQTYEEKRVSNEKERSLLDLEAKYMMDNARKAPEYYQAWVDAVSQDQESVIYVGRGETICIRVPVSGPNSSIRWEFATLDFDIIFGLGFECVQNNAVVFLPILPNLRCDSHLHVMSGSHTTHSEGVYLLKFDNSYSLFRSKTLLYRVFTSRPE